MYGYRGMLNDKMPKTWNWALKWCGAKRLWIEHVYNNIIKKYPASKRSQTVKLIVGIKKEYTRQEIYDYMKYVMFRNVTINQVNNIPEKELYRSFEDSIIWGSLKDKDEYYYWKNICGWVAWFRTAHALIEYTYTTSRQAGKSEKVCKREIMEKYNLTEKLANFIIKTF